MRSTGSSYGFTLIELAITVGIAGTLAALAVPLYVGYLEKARVARAIAEIRYLEEAIDLYQISNGTLPNALADVGSGNVVDPWGNPYQYLNFSGAGKGQARKDRFLVPINSNYDLYSKGKDGDSKPPLTVKVSWDDIVRANDGAFVGLASEF